jgi:hypothetical protein
LTQIKTSHYCDIFTHLLGNALSAKYSMKICIYLRNLRTTAFLGFKQRAFLTGLPICYLGQIASSFANDGLQFG